MLILFEKVANIMETLRRREATDTLREKAPIRLVQLFDGL